LAETIDRSVEKKSGSRPNAGAAARQAVFARSGEFWTVGYAGATSSLRDIKGLTYIQRLLRHPGDEFHALDVLSDPNRDTSSDNRDAASLIGHPSVSIRGLGDAGVMLDEQAKREYKCRLAELREQADDLLERGDHDRASEMEAEIEFLQREIARAVGLGGRDRRAGSAAERARLSVTRAIKGALQKISEHHSDLGAVLETSIRTGSFCSYVPDFRTHVSWRFSLEEPDSLEPEKPSTVDDNGRKTVFLKGETGLLQSFADGTAFVGRELEIDVLRHALAKSLLGEGRIVLISGSPGVGKTRLAAEIAVEASKHEALVFIGNCYDREDSVPFVPFVEMLESALARLQSPESFRDSLGNDACEIARLLPELRRLFPDIPMSLELPPEQSRRALFKSVANFFTRLATTQPLLLFFDDVHWADEGTLALLNHLARSVSQLPVMIMGAYRDIEAHSPRPLVKALDELIHLQVVHRIHLRGLDKRAIIAMLSAFSGRAAPDYLTNLILKETEGNPFFVEELFRHLVEQGKLLDSAGEFRLDLKPEEIDVPRSVRLVIGRRLARLSVEAQKILSTAGIIGRSFTFSLLEASTGVEAEQLLDHVEEAERTGLINSAVEYPEAKFHFSHELVRRATIDGLSSPRRQRLHLSIADALERLYSGTVEDHAEDLAHHLWNAGSSADIRRTLRFLAISAKRALEQSAYEVSLAHVQNALDLLNKLPGTAERARRELEVQLVRGVALVAREGWFGRAAGDVYRRARELCEELADDSRLFSVLFGLWSFHLTKGAHRLALKHADEMLRYALRSQDDGKLVQAHWAVGCSQFFMGEFLEADKNLSRAMSYYDFDRHRELAFEFAQDPYMSSLVFKAMILWMRGFPEQAEVRAQEALTYARKLGFPFTLSWCLDELAIHYSICGEFDHAARLIEEGMRQSREQGYAHFEEALIACQLIALAARGRIDEFAATSRRVRKFSEIDYDIRQTWIRSALAEGLGKAGKIPLAMSLIADAEALLERTEERFLESEVLRIRAELILMQNPGDPLTPDTIMEAEKNARRAVEIARRRGARMLEIRAVISLAHILARTGRGGDALRVIKEICDQFTECRETPEFKVAQALADSLSSAHDSNLIQ
jgi:predicted ATPase